jgi:MurNAc alpha-1-phosphate uridylyltransferase
MIPRTAMLLAAGLGTRMRPLTEHTAKPLLPLGGRTLLDHALTRLAAAGVETVVVNAHWHAGRVAAHLATHWGAPLPPLPLWEEAGGRGRAGAAATPTREAARAPGSRPTIVLQREEDLLDTGGAVRAALETLGSDPFFVVNGDSFWLDGPAASALARLAAAWDDGLDALLLVHATFQVSSEVGTGDFFLDPLARLRRRRPREIAPHVYAGVQVLHPRLFAGTHQRAFSTNALWDRAIAAGRARAVVHDGLWFHLSTPADLARAESVLQTGAVGETR